MKVWIYNILTTDQMWCKCVSKYGICDINTVVNKAFIYYSGNVTYTIFTYTFAPHLNCSQYIINPNFNAVITRLSCKYAGKGAMNATYVPDLKCVGADKINVHACMRITIIYSVTL